MHLDSQKRVYVPGVTYFITTVTKNRYPYFIEGVFLDLFIHDLYICQDIRNFELHGFAVIPDHVHLLISPGNGHSHSEIMHNLKRVTSLHINQIMHGNLIYGTVLPVKGARPTAESADIYPRLRGQRAPCIHCETRSAPFPEMISRLRAYRAEFAAMHAGPCPIPPSAGTNRSTIISSVMKPISATISGISRASRRSTAFRGVCGRPARE